MRRSLNNFILNSSVKLIGLTGSIAMGKSFVAQIFIKNKIPVFDSDLVVAKILSLSSITHKISKIFPQVIEGNNINKILLASHVFNNVKALKKLEAIIHPIINEEIRKFILSYNFSTDMLIIDIPLLFEKSYENIFDYIIVASAPSYLQKKRALKRKNMTNIKLNHIIKNQLSDFKKRCKADYIIHTGLNKSLVYREVKNFINMVSNA